MNLFDSLREMFGGSASRSGAAVPSYGENVAIFDGIDPERGTRTGDVSFGFVYGAERLPGVTNNPGVIAQLRAMAAQQPFILVSYEPAEGYVTRVNGIQLIKAENKPTVVRAYAKV